LAVAVARALPDLEQSQVIPAVLEVEQLTELLAVQRHKIVLTELVTETLAVLKRLPVLVAEVRAQQVAELTEVTGSILGLLGQAQRTQE
jgi:hypothetical protein